MIKYGYSQTLHDERDELVRIRNHYDKALVQLRLCIQLLLSFELPHTPFKDVVSSSLWTGVCNQPVVSQIPPEEFTAETIAYGSLQIIFFMLWKFFSDVRLARPVVFRRLLRFLPGWPETPPLASFPAPFHCKQVP